MLADVSTGKSGWTFCMSRTRIVCWISLVLLFALVGPVSAATYTISDSVTMAEFQDNVTRMNDGDILLLNPGTYYVNGITFSHNITIGANTGAGGNSENTIIDGIGGTSGIFCAIGTGNSITIDNLGFRNGNSANQGGVINSRGNTIVTSSTFTSCSAVNGGGAIFSMGSTTVISSTFTNCSASNGGAIDSMGNLTVTSSLFSDCSADTSGGALQTWGGTVTIVTDTTFINCSATSGSSNNNGGGAIQSYGDTLTLVNSSTFTNCSASNGKGGAIFAGAFSFTGGKVIVTSSTISHCSALSNGGAIFAYDNVTVTESTLSNCSSDAEGGAIYSYKSATVSSTTLANCSAHLGGAIRSYGGGPVTVTNSTISNCIATVNGGGAIYTPDNVIVTSSVISNCSAIGYGGAIYGDSSGSLVMVNSSTIQDCSSETGGGAIYSYDNEVMVTSLSTITNCSATNGSGGAIYTTGGSVTVTDSTISGCMAGNNGGGISSGNNVNITSSSISTCSATGNGGAISTYAGTIKFCRLVNNNGSVAVHSSGGTVTTRDNWWGSNDNPSTQVSGASTSPWLVLNVTASPASVTTGQTSMIEANLTFDSDGIWHDPALGHVPDNIPITYTASSGSVLPSVGEMSDGANVTIFSPAVDGIVMVNATVDGQTVSTVGENPPTPDAPVADFTADVTSGIAPLIVQFTDLSTGSPTSWNWSFGDGDATNATVQNPVHTYTYADLFNVSLTVSNANGNNTITKYWFINVTNATEPPVAAFTASPTSGTAPLWVNFTDMSTGSPTSWNWTFDDGVFSEEQNTWVNYPVPGNYTVTLTVSNAVGTNTTTKTEYIHVTPVSDDYFLYLYPGWNFISVPKTLSTGNNTAAIFHDVDSEGHSIFQYDANTKQWTAMTAGTKVNVLDGIWIYSATTTPVPLYFMNDPLQTPPTKMLYPGWNAIGFSDTIPASARDTLIPVQGTWTTLIAYNSWGQQYDPSIISGSTDFLHGDTNPMWPQQGYWLYMTDGGELAAISV